MYTISWIICVETFGGVLQATNMSLHINRKKSQKSGVVFTVQVSPFNLQMGSSTSHEIWLGSCNTPIKATVAAPLRPTLVKVLL